MTTIRWFDEDKNVKSGLFYNVDDIKNMGFDGYDESSETIFDFNVNGQGSNVIKDEKNWLNVTINPLSVTKTMGFKSSSGLTYCVIYTIVPYGTAQNGAQIQWHAVYVNETPYTFDLSPKYILMFYGFIALNNLL